MLFELRTRKHYSQGNHSAVTCQSGFWESLRPEHGLYGSCFLIIGFCTNKVPFSVDLLKVGSVPILLMEKRRHEEVNSLPTMTKLVSGRGIEPKCPDCQFPALTRGLYASRAILFQLMIVQRSVSLAVIPRTWTGRRQTLNTLCCPVVVRWGKEQTR